MPRTSPRQQAPVELSSPAPALPGEHVAASEQPRPAGSAGPHRTRVVAHPESYALQGMPVWCTVCGARRDWAFINHGRHVWVRCRCGHEWHEPELTRADFDALVLPGAGVEYANVDEMLAKLGFDGIFRGMYLG